MLYQQQFAQERSDALDAMTRDAVGLGLYDDTAVDYTAALRRARKG